MMFVLPLLPLSPSLALPPLIHRDYLPYQKAHRLRERDQYRIIIYRKETASNKIDILSQAFFSLPSSFYICRSIIPTSMCSDLFTVFSPFHHKATITAGRSAQLSLSPQRGGVYIPGIFHSLATVSITHQVHDQVNDPLPYY